MSAEDQTEAALAFLLARMDARAGYAQDRCWGISSDALARYGVDPTADPPPLGRYPADRGDLAACERTYSMAPEHVQARMLPVLEAYRTHVARRWPS